MLCRTSRVYQLSAAREIGRIDGATLGRLRVAVLDQILRFDVMRDLGVLADDREHIVVVGAVYVLGVRDRNDRAWRQSVPEPGQDAIKVHPVEACAAGDEAIRRLERRILSATDRPTDPPVAGLRADAEPPRSWRQRGRRVDAVGEGDHPSSERARAGPSIEHGARRDEQPVQDRQHLGGVGRAKGVEPRDLRVAKDIGQRHLSIILKLLSAAPG